MQIEPIRNFFAALFLASIGMLIHVHFLWNHVDILLASVILVITIKTIIIALVVKGFGYNKKTSLLVSFILCILDYVLHLNFEITWVLLLVQVGMSLAQIGEFAFVLLSRASNIHLVEVSATAEFIVLWQDGCTSTSLVKNSFWLYNLLHNWNFELSRGNCTCYC